MAKIRQNKFSQATTDDEAPDVFHSVDEIIARRKLVDETATESLNLPYYMAVRLTRQKKKPKRSTPSYASPVGSLEEDHVFGNKLKREFWYAVPRSKADNIYHFLLQWSPDKYGQDTTPSDLGECSVESANKDSSRDNRGFIVLDSTVDEGLSGHFAPLSSILVVSIASKVHFFHMTRERNN
ncbi:hypothetical protein KIN20_004575 [Parelaphostrongylus tenuis]|uniref:Uncharacterized protein n=1 Tax=Parelaphostrongylus tenuis TaxID=148309 RepID=A0AAD5MRK5_PARTN|nr:hypothetical protein KIN20_004575 [Parelaphostrongylus tenuis]